MGDKRKRVVLSIQQKLEILDKLENGSNVRQIAVEYNIGNNTVRDIKKQKGKLIAFSSASDSTGGMKKRKTMKRSSYEQLDNAMLEWLTQQKALNNSVSGTMCANQAKLFYNKLGLEGEFDASTGWLTRFKYRYGIGEIGVQEKTESQETIDEFVKEFEEFIIKENLTPDQIYNADETGLYWRCLPLTKVFQSNKSNDERLTIMCCTNASGKHKLKLTVISKDKKLKSIKGTDVRNVPVDYFSQNEAWMNKAIFKEWFTEKFVPEVSKYLKGIGVEEKAVLILDNAPCHPNEIDLKSEDGKIFAKCLPSKITASINPMDQGIINELKYNYRINILQKCIQECSNLKSFWNEFTKLDAIYEISEEWEKIQPDTFVNSWKRITGDVIEEEALTTKYSADELLTKVQTVSDGDPVDLDSINEWLECDINDQGFEMMTCEDIINKIMKVREDIESSETSDEEFENDEILDIKHSTALQCVEKLLDYVNSQKDSLSCDITILRKLKNSIKQKCFCKLKI